MYVRDPLIELLAIKLYEHDHTSGGWPITGDHMPAWNALPEEDREGYRQIARGERLYGKEVPF